VDTTETTHISLCTGYGGIDLGLRRVLPDVRTIAYVEIEAFACANLVEKMERELLDAAPIWTNLKTFNAKPFLNKVDILSGGFPCQPFSHAGQRKGTEDPRHLFPDIERIILECKPNIIFLENVEGIIPAKYQGEPDTSVLQYVLGRLEELGYRTEAGVFSAIECGAPHQRKRVFICGVYEALGNSNDKRFKGEQEVDGCQTSLEECCGGHAHRHDSTELADTRRNECGGRSTVGEVQETDGGETSQSQGRCEGREDNTRERTECQPGDECAEVGNTKHNGSYTKERHEAKPISNQQKNRISERRSCSVCEFPSRPEQDQHYWEAPRTIGSEEVITAVGGATYGIADGNMVRAHRVDSLRLLGNGVVPIVAFKAFTILMARINKGQ